MKVNTYNASYNKGNQEIFQHINLPIMTVFH